MSGHEPKRFYWAHVVVVIAGLAMPAFVRADGLVLARQKGLHFVAEKEQRAYIECDAGHERLHVATRTEANANPTLWIVPVPAEAAQVRAEPAEFYPHVGAERSVVASARAVIRQIRATALLADAGLAGVFATTTKVHSVFAGISGVQVSQHVEKLGMVVEVLSAESPDALDAYLAEKQVPVRAGDINSLQPYFQAGHAFVCGWSIAPGLSNEARCLQIDFPSAAAFFPLRPSSVYPGDIRTVVYVRGWFHPRPGHSIPGLTCRYIFGGLAHEGLILDQTNTSKPLTRVEVSGSPQQWDQDLILDPGEPLAVQVAQGIGALGSKVVPWSAAVLGLILGTFLPFLVFDRNERRGPDFIWSSAVGAAIALTIFASALVFAVWCYFRIPAGQRASLEIRKACLWCCLWALAAALATFLLEQRIDIDGTVELDFQVVQWYDTSFITAIGILAAIMSIAFVPLVLAALAGGRKLVGLMLFSTLHILTSMLICGLADRWLQSY
jgi:hypothetical protein